MSTIGQRNTNPTAHRRSFNDRVRVSSLVIASMLAIAGVGCASDPTESTSDQLTTSVVATSSVRSMAHDLLVGFNDGDYEIFSRYWDDELKAGVDSGTFHEFQRATVADSGRYREISSIDAQPGKDAGTTNFFVRAEFTEHPMVLRLNIRNGSNLISGIELTRES